MAKNDPFGIIDAFGRMNEKLELPEEAPLSDLSEIAGFYGAMEAPDSEPLPGWELVIPDDGSICHIVRPSRAGFGMSSYKLTPEVQEWCDENLRETYYVLGAGFELGSGAWGTSQTLRFYFTLEHDYILFKLRWG